MPAPPAPLATRVRDALSSALAVDASALPDVALAEAERLLGALLRGRAAGRDRALDLLAADALVTYAFEAASDEPATIERRADEAMRRLSAVAVEARA